MLLGSSLGLLGCEVALLGVSWPLVVTIWGLLKFVEICRNLLKFVGICRFLLKFVGLHRDEVGDLLLSVLGGLSIGLALSGVWAGVLLLQPLGDDRQESVKLLASLL